MPGEERRLSKFHSSDVEESTLNILYLVHRIPFPPNKGDKIRSFNILKHLSRKHRIYLGTVLDHASDAAHVAELQKYCCEVYCVPPASKLGLLRSLVTQKPLTVSHFYDRSLQHYVDRTLEENGIDVVLCICSGMAEYVFRTPVVKENRMNGLKLVMDYIDLDSDKWSQFAEYASFPLRHVYRLENRRLSHYEGEVNRVFHQSIFVSQHELDTVESLTSNVVNGTVVSNGVDVDYFKPKERLPANENPVVLFTGVMDYFANVDAVEWFCERILDKVRAEVPETQFYIVGMRPTRKVRNLAQLAGVHVTGYVDDIRAYYRMADVAVAPLRIAQGVQNKVLEAMSTRNAIVATSKATNGIVCRDHQDLLLADDADAFSQHVIALLQDDEQRWQMGGRAVQTIREHYNWENNLARLDTLLQ